MAGGVACSLLAHAPSGTGGVSGVQPPRRSTGPGPALSVTGRGVCGRAHRQQRAPNRERCRGLGRRETLRAGHPSSLSRTPAAWAPGPCPFQRGEQTHESTFTGLVILGVPRACRAGRPCVPGRHLHPIAGAFLSGPVAVLVAPADDGTSTVLWALGVVVAVQAMEGNFLQPFIQSRRTRRLRSADPGCPGAAVAARAVVSYVTRVPRPAGTTHRVGRRWTGKCRRGGRSHGTPDQPMCCCWGGRPARLGRSDRLLVRRRVSKLSCFLGGFCSEVGCVRACLCGQQRGSVRGGLCGHLRGGGRLVCAG